MSSNKAQFIVIEGLDGSGSSTQSSMLLDSLSHDNISSIVTSEPTNGPIGSLIRQALHQRINFHEDPVAFDRQLAYLFGADRFDHLHNPLDGVFSKLESGISVISTRYFYSSYAYHVTCESTFELVSRINKDFPHPDKLIYLELSVENSIKRTANRKSADLYERREKLEKVIHNYEKSLSLYPRQLLRIDATLPRDEVHRQILNYVLTDD